MIPGSANPLLLATAAAGGYSISRSVRLNSADSAYFSRTPASSGNRKTWTWAGWVKRSVKNTSTDQMLFTGGATNSATGFLALDFNSSDKLRLSSATTNLLITTAIYRDASAWMHIVLAFDSTQGTDANKAKLYVNGAEVTTFDTDGRSGISNQDYGINQAAAHEIGRASLGSNKYLDGYLADVHFIDGQALDPTSFGEFSATTGVWMPKAYTGSYGTNGFHLDFADNSSAAALGYDAAGSNDWTVNNLSVTAGAGNDSLVDVPTNGTETDTGVGGEVRGNYCTWNPLEKAANATLSNGNLDITQASGDQNTGGTIAVSSGKWYWEVTFASGTESRIGAIKQQFVKTDSPFAIFLGGGANGYSYANGGYKSNNNNNSATGYSTYTTNDVISVALDLDNGRIFFAKNGTWQESGNPATGSNPAYTGLSGAFTPAVYTPNATLNANFGQRPFAYTAPSGFKALNTASLPAPVVTKPNTVMDVVLYTGTGSALTPTSTLGFNPDLVWIKSRSAATDHAWYDAVRGAEKRLESNNTDDEVTTDGGVTAFNSNGFTLGTLAQVNTNAATYVAWCWDENVSAGFDIVTYTGNGSARTINHSLGVVPSLIIVKARTTASTDQGWPVYHSANTANPETDYLLLNSTAATADLDTVWNDTAPTSSVFSVGTNALVNANNDTYVAYCFAPVAGYSAFGSYTANGSSDGPFVYTGFRPRFVLAKRSDSTSDWGIYDAARGSYNAIQATLYPSLSNAEASGTDRIDFLSNGFKLRIGGASEFNWSGATVIYAAFAESPFNYARAR